MSSRALRVLLVAVVAIAVVAVGIVFFVLRRGSGYVGGIPVVDKDDIPVFTCEVSNISVPIKADCRGLASRIREAATTGMEFPCSLDSGSQKIAKSWGRYAIFYYKADLLSLDFSLLRVPYAGKSSSPVLNVTGKVHLYGNVQEKWGGKKICKLGDYSGTFSFLKSYIVSLDESAKLVFMGSGQATVEAVGPTVVKIGFARFNGSGFVDDFITPVLRKKVDAALNTEIQENDPLSPLYDEAWEALHSPIKLSSGVWLVFHPEEFEVAQLRSTGPWLEPTLETTVTVRGRPKVILGDKPQVSEVPPRPPVRLGKAKGGLHVVVDAVVPLDEAERLLNKELGQLEKFIYNEANVKVKVPKARVYTCEDCLRLELLLTEPFEGSVFLEGAPRYDAETNELYVEGLDFTVDTKNVLAKSGSWLLDFPPLMDYLQKKVRLPVGGQLATVGEAISKYDGEEIADGMVLQIGDTSFEMLCVYNTMEEMHFIVQADGSAEVAMN